MLTSIIYYIHFATTGMFMLNNMKATTNKQTKKLSKIKRERENALMPVTV